MQLGLSPLFRAIDADRSRPWVLATVVATEGHTYRKPGAMMLIRPDGTCHGLLSGGCFEAELAEHAKTVLDTGEPRIERFDMRSGDDLVWGLGLGCNGAVDVLLQRASAENGFAGLTAIRDWQRRRRGCLLARVYGSDDPDYPPGTWALAGADGRPSSPDSDSEHDPTGALTESLAGAAGDRCASHRRFGTTTGDVRLLAVPIDPVPRLLVLGGGPDAQPLVAQAAAAGWESVVVDHRPAYAREERFPEATQVIRARPNALAERGLLDGVDAAVVMSHNFELDAGYLAALARKPPAYIGLLGPGERRRRLLRALEPADAAAVEPRSHGPAGLDIGSELPEGIALSILAEAQAVLAGRDGRSLSPPAAPASEGSAA